MLNFFTRCLLEEMIDGESAELQLLSIIVCAKVRTLRWGSLKVSFTLYEAVA